MSTKTNLPYKFENKHNLLPDFLCYNEKYKDLRVIMHLVDKNHFTTQQ